MDAFTVLHTSDWHLGHQLYRRRREEEFIAFLEWIEDAIRRHRVNALVVAGDIFDSSTPGPATQKMYYDFLTGAANAGASHVVITAGNHDSPGLLTAAGAILERLSIHVVGTIRENPEDEIRILRDASGEPRLVVCAAPYIRERDARDSRPGENREERERGLLEGIATHYRRLAELAESGMARLGVRLPVLATGHLFAAGAQTGETERELYIGALGQLPHTIFPDTFDYVALGHIHRPQKVGGCCHIRYSGSPLPLTFAEARHQKQVLLLRFHGRKPEITELTVPLFRRLERIRGNFGQLLDEVKRLRLESLASGESIWIEAHHTGNEDPANLARNMAGIAAGSQLEILCVKTDFHGASAPAPEIEAGLETLAPEDIFAMLLENSGLSAEARKNLAETFRELVNEWHEQKRNQDGQTCA